MSDPIEEIRKRVTKENTIRLVYGPQGRKDVTALLAEIDRLREVVVNLWKQADPPKDWACPRCRPESDMLVEGFVCAYHKAEDIATEALKGGSE